jgi:hypothetical protein
VPYKWARIQYTEGLNNYQSGSVLACVGLTAFGAVGEDAVGTFAAELVRVSGSGPTSVLVTGVFRVPRQN